MQQNHEYSCGHLGLSTEAVTTTERQKFLNYAQI